MSRVLRDLREFLFPGSVRSRAIPPLEAGLRPNRRLDEATVVLRSSGLDDASLVAGRPWLTVGDRVHRLGDGGAELVADLAGQVTALAGDADSAVAAVAGRGLVRVSATGSTELISEDTRLLRCVTAMALHPREGLLVCVGSTATESWAHNLVADDDHTGLLLWVRDDEVSVLAERLGWPSGVAVSGESLLLSLSVDHRVELRPLADPSRSGKQVLSNLPGYPGRISSTDVPGEWWLAMPYLRNRATELILSEPEVLGRMVAETEPGSWLVPTLRIENHYRSPLQVGSVRVLGEIKPWAPSRTYGLAARFTEHGRVLDSVHSRADGVRHGVTGVVQAPAGEVLVLCAGADEVVLLEEAR